MAGVQAKPRCLALPVLLMGKAQVVGTSHQIHPGFQRAQATGGVTALACQDGQPLTERAIGSCVVFICTNDQ